MSRRIPPELCDDKEMEPRVRALEVNYATTAQQVDSLFDNGQPGLLSRIQKTLGDKIDGYSEIVNKFIEGEPTRKAHIERNAQQAVLDAKEVARQALEETEREQNRLHQENQRKGEKTDQEIAKLREDFSRHEKFVQRGVGALILGQVTIVFGGFCIAFLTFLGGAVWWVFTHVPITK
jgi:hypothetical protein